MASSKFSTYVVDKKLYPKVTLISQSSLSFYTEKT